MYADRINILHVADGDHISGGIPHHLVLDFLPAGDAALHQHLSHTGEPEPVGKDLYQFLPVSGDSSAGTTQRVGGTQDNRVADLLRESNAVLHVMDDKGSRYRLADFFHRILEGLPVLGLFYSQSCRSDQAHVLLLQEPSFFQLHGKIQTCLSAQCGKNAVRLLLPDQLLHHLYRQGFNINPVRDILIRHDGRRVGIQQDNLHSLFLQRTAGLGTGVIKFGCLSDDDGTGTDNQNLFYTQISWHYLFPPIISIKRSNRYPESLGPGEASGWNCTVKMFLFRYFSPSFV